MSKTILAVDDFASLRQRVACTLKGAGYEVIEAADGEEGLAEAKGAVVGLVLTDRNMPQMDGLTLVKNLRSLPQYAATPILLTTGSADAMKAAGRAAGAPGCRVKPFDPAKLIEVMKKACA